VLPGAIKAWKLHHDQTQNIAVPIGRIKMVIYDSRLNSSTKGNIQILELGRPDVYLRVQIPPGLWYGFTCISNTPALLVNCADMPHDPKESKRKPISDSSIPYDWLIESK
jgi:dTDP-4-dehydrorhamnose 3,5-epimerase